MQHGAALRAESFSTEQVAALAAGDYEAAGLDARDTAIARFVAAVVTHAEELSQSDIDALRAHGLDDGEVFDVVLAAAARVFWSRTNDAIGYDPPAWWVTRSREAFGAEVFRALTVGRSFGPADAAPDSHGAPS